MSKFNPIINVDFDGVIHSYTSGWNDVDIVDDEPVLGAFDWLLAMLQNQDKDGIPMPVIYSSRSKAPAGIKAMKEWFLLHGFPKDMLDLLEFPTQKPAAFLTIDDRAMCFNGTFPTIEDMVNFRPWNRLGSVTQKVNAGKSEKLTFSLTGKQAAMIAEFAGYTVSEETDPMVTNIVQVVEKLNDGIPITEDDGSVTMHSTIVYCDECREEGVTSLDSGDPDGLT